MSNLDTRQKRQKISVTSPPPNKYSHSQMKAEEAIKTAQKKETEEKESSAYQQQEYTNSFNSNSNSNNSSSPQNSAVNMSQISQYSDLNRHIQMVS